MQTVVGISISPYYALPIMAAMVMIGRLLMFRVRLFLSTWPGCYQPAHAAVLAGIWLYSMAGMLILISPAPLNLRIFDLLMVAFLLQMAVTDALSGYLPRTFCLRFLLAGILMVFSTSVPGDVLWRLTETALISLLLFILHHAVNRQQLHVGTGDLWLISGLTVWVGLPACFWSTLLGVSGFVLWHSTWRFRGAISGPLGPWLCLGSCAILIDKLYQPLWVI
ncbi:prepilin peptidase [Salmonella enterica subsp. enterica serovar Legon]|nr:prepilin peptidase [Salmonella enterica subsp. enterica serovar Weybridge]EDS6807261.1 prepilin peptidase [Salmonella enterica subsp. enterica serovar Legon]EDW9825413.1 prepilin peptidase [Salmonella enterica]EDZ3589466.1 prepilin peptidase [Salmonella enterica subsp. enterica serovar Wagenia]EHL5833733.1 prepilin peptidase [Salmonella enterica]